MLRCPHCFSKDQSNLSRFRGWDYVLALLLLRPYRCRLCQTRFFARFRSTRETDSIVRSDGDIARERSTRARFTSTAKM